jgi:hypothetical protein
VSLRLNAPPVFVLSPPCLRNSPFRLLLFGGALLAFEFSATPGLLGGTSLRFYHALVRLSGFCTLPRLLGLSLSAFFIPRAYFLPESVAVNASPP